MSSPTPRRRASVTMADVAAAAGVAIGTVSNALNHPERVTDELLARVHKAIAELGFVRNSAARSHAAGSSSTVGFVLVDLANSLFVDMARGAERAAQDAGMYLVLANSDISVDKQATYLEHFSQEQVAGILLTLVAGDRSGLERARNAGRHVVILDADRVDDFCVVGTDYEQAGYLAAQHLISLGRTRLAFAGGPIWMSAIGDRLRGVERAVAENPGVTVTHLDSDEIQAEDGRLIGWRLADLPRAEIPDGIVAAADLVALGLMQALVDRDIRFPEDIALIACDDNKSAYDSLIPISTIDLPGYQMGLSAMQLLLEEIRSGTHTHRRVIIEPHLTARESTVGRGARRTYTD
jgi:LacI family transcriptional regulator